MDNIKKFEIELNIYTSLVDNNILPDAVNHLWQRQVILLLVFIAKMVFWLVKDKSIDNDYRFEE